MVIIYAQTRNFRTTLRAFKTPETQRYTLHQVKTPRSPAPRLIPATEIDPAVPVDATAPLKLEAPWE